MLNKLISIIVLFCIVEHAEATIHRVNNNTGVNANFSTLGAAITAATSGDSIYIEPSTTAYSFASNTKRLVYIGNGYFLSGVDGNTGLQHNTNPSILNALSSVTPTTIGPGSKFIGITFNGGSSIGSGDFQQLTFEKCRFTSGFFFTASGTCSNVTLRKCYIGSVSTGAFTTNSSTAILAGVTVENCIIISTAVEVSFGTALGGSSNVFRNNTVVLLSASGKIRLSNAYCTNNIICRQASNGNSSTDLFQSVSVGYVMRNNLFLQNVAPAISGTGNVDNRWNGDGSGVTFDHSTVFAGGASADGQWDFAPSSNARAIGRSVGTVINPDIGAFGGTDPYKLSGIPNIPTIYSLSVPASVMRGQTLNVTFSTRSNN